jgi:Phage terminase large subunit
MATLRIPTAPVFKPLLAPARYKGAYGGRGSGKSHFFGELMVEECLIVPGTLAVCIREVQKSLMQSSKRLIETKIQQLDVGDQFKILHDRIVTPGDGLIIVQGMQDATAESIKSLEGFRIAWVEEAQTLSQRSLSSLRPTIRTEGSQLWANWNPRRKSDAIDDSLRAKRPDNAVVVQANWRDNPWFPDVLDEERRLDLEIYPERYAHVWEATTLRPSRARTSRQASGAGAEGWQDRPRRCRSCAAREGVFRHWWRRAQLRRDGYLGLPICRTLTRAKGDIPGTAEHPPKTIHGRQQQSRSPLRPAPGDIGRVHKRAI